MAVIKAKISAFSYLNTVPFVYGIKHEGSLDAQLLLSPPATSAENFIQGLCDLALLPAAVVPSLRGAEIITDYCIGASGAVRTVVLVGNTPIGKMRRILLDPHSRTSVQLVGWLAKNCWKIAPEWETMSDYSCLDNLQEGEACLLIGDKVFAHENRFAYRYDLAEEWTAQTHLPFVFAVWVGRKGLSYEVHDALQRSLTYGVERIYEAVVESPFADKVSAYDYLTNNIDFLFNTEKQRALEKFWNLGIKVAPKVNPG